MPRAPTSVRSPRPISPRTLAVLATAFLIGCLADLTGPKPTTGRIGIAPVFLTGTATRLVSFDRIRILITRPASTSSVVDTVINFAPGDSAIEVDLSLPMGELFELWLSFIDVTGDTVYRSGPDSVTASLVPTVVQPELAYSGVGSDAVGVRFVTTAAEVSFQDTVVLVAEAFGSDGVAIPGTPIVYELANSADSTKARIPNIALGRVVGGQVRGSVAVRARLLTGQSAVHTLTVQPVASAISVIAGNDQVARVGESLPQGAVFRVLASDGLPVQGAIVDFSPTGGSLSQVADTSDASGDVSVMWTLGNTAGSHSLTATLVRLATATAQIAATADPAAASALVFTQQPANTTAGAGMTVVVTAKDSLGNVATEFNANVELAITGATGTAGAHLIGTATSAAVAGIATFTNIALDSAGSDYTLSATAAGIPNAVSGAFSVLYGTATRLRFVTQPSNAQAGSSISSMQVFVEDALGNRVAVAVDAVSLAITSGTGTAGATLLGTSTITASGGAATFAGLTIQKSGSAYTLTATSGTLTVATSTAFDIAPGQATTMAVNDGNAQSAQVASVVATDPSVLVTDAYANPVPGVPVTFAVAGGAGSGTDLTQSTDVNGVARVGSWTLGTLVGANALTATSSEISGTTVTFTATGTAGPPALFAVLAGDNQTASVDAAVITQPTVRLTDAYGNVLAGVEVTFAVAGGGGSASGTTVTTDSEGDATVGGWTLGPTPTINELTVTAGAASKTLTARSIWNRSMASSLSTACAIGSGNAVYCWGENSFDAFGVSTATVTGSSTPYLTPLASVVAMADGMGRHYCGITSTQSAVCWGRNGFGQLGGGSTSGMAPVTVNGGISWAQLSMSILSTCGVSTMGIAYCWGSNQHGEIGVASIPINTSTASPVPIDGGLTFTQVAAGWLHACGITAGGAAYCWGDNANGQIGIGATSGDVRTPTAVVGGHQFIYIASGAQQTCGITVARQTYCWGLNVSGQLGDGTTTTRPSPTLVSGGHRFTNIAMSSGTGAGHTCAVTESGEPYCWGLNSHGQLGDGTRTNALVPTPVAGGLRISGLTVGSTFSCAMSAQSIWCWGWNDVGQLGNGTPMFETSPTAVLGGLTLQSVVTGGFHSCGLTTAGAAYCWGANTTGQLGGGNLSISFSSTPVPVLGDLTFSSLSAGSTHTCGVATSGAAYCWGSNSQGQIGDATNTQRTSPAAVAGGLTFQALNAGGNHTCGLTTVGVGYCWGSNNGGQLGNGTTTSTNSPIAISGSLTFQSIDGGSNYSCGVTITGVGYCWGSNSNAQLGDGTTTGPRLVPTLIAGGLTLRSVVVNPGQFHGCAITLLDAAYCWGFNAAGQIGNGTTNTTNTSPVAVLGGLSFDRLTAGTFQTCGLTTAAIAYCWGANTLGQLGDATTTSRSTPTAVAGGLTFISLSSRGQHSCGVATGGAVYCWGGNSSGQLGNGIAPTPPTRVTGF